MIDSHFITEMMRHHQKARAGFLHHVVQQCVDQRLCPGFAAGAPRHPPPRPGTPPPAPYAPPACAPPDRPAHADAPSHANRSVRATASDCQICGVCPQTGVLLRRNVRPFTVRYKGQALVVDLPGYYPDDEGESVHVGDDMAVTDEALRVILECFRSDWKFHCHRKP
jgi:hypothetical protein